MRLAGSPLSLHVFLRIVSPGSGAASGWRKYTGNRIDTGTACPRVFAGMNRSSLRSSHRRRIERGIAVELSATSCRLAHDLPFLVDEDAERHVRLHLLRVEGRRIPERKFLVQHHRQYIGSRRLLPKTHPRPSSSFPAACRHRRAMHAANRPFIDIAIIYPCLARLTSRSQKRQRLEWSHRIRIHSSEAHPSPDVAPRRRDAS